MGQMLDAREKEIRSARKIFYSQEQFLTHKKKNVSNKGTDPQM